MAFGILPMILGASTIVGGHLTRQTITSGLRSGLGQFGQSLPFGAGYSLGTYLGFPKNYKGDSKAYKPKIYSMSNNMAYGKTRKWFSYRRTQWYWKPTYHRKLRRTVYTHPRGGY